jgi:hypothetical protein
MYFKQTLVILLGNTAMLALRSAASEMVNCEEVDFETFNSYRTADSLPRIGVMGMYASTPDGGCAYVDASSGSTFAMDYPEEHGALVRVATEAAKTIPGIDFVSAHEQPTNRRTGCGQICSGAGCNSCTCQWEHTICELQACWTINICK